MAFGNGPKIVTSGLILSLDAADRNSYSGTGTVWNDLSGNGNNGTLTNGPTYSSTNGGSIVFDGVDDYISGSLATSLSNSEFTIGIWLKTGNISSNKIVFSLGTEASNNKSIHLRFVSSTTSFRFDLYTSGLVTTLSNTSANFTYLTCTLNSSLLQSVYQNGSFISSRTATGLFTGNTVYNLGRWGLEAPQFNLPGEYWNGNISQVTVYNRALSATEILQNYNALKSRFNLK
jgi:hypothetical protein